MLIADFSTDQRFDASFAALADPTRRAILARLAQGEATVAELTLPFRMSQPAISRHLKVLENAGLISSATDAQRRPRRLEGKPLAEIYEWLQGYRQFWEQSFARLDGLLEELKRDERAPVGPRRKARTKPNADADKEKTR